MEWIQVIYRLQKRAWQPGERIGQAYFNELYEIEPEIADLIRGTDADPFYANSPDDPRISKFFETIIPFFGS